MSFSKPDGGVFNWLGEFVSTDAENKFQEYNWKDYSQKAQFVCKWGSAAYAGGILVDLLDTNLSLSLEFWIMASLRLIILIAGSSISVVYAKNSHYLDLTYWLTGYMLLYGIAESIGVCINSRLGYISTGVDLLVIIVFLYYLLMPQRPLSSMIGGWGCSLLYSFALLAQPAAILPHFFMNTICLLCFNCFGQFLVIHTGRVQRNEYWLLEEERRLNVQLQKTKHELERYYQLFIENTIDVVYLYRLTEPVGLQYVSPSVEQLSGYEAARFKTFRQFMHVIHPDDRAKISRVIRTLYRDDSPTIFRIVTKANDLVWAEHKFRIVDHPEGKSIEGVIRNITNRVFLEQNIAKLDRLNIAAQMAASLAHEIRNPLTTVRGYLGFFRNKQAFSSYQDQMDLIISELDRTNTIISEYLSLTRNKTMETTECNLNEILHSLYPLIQTHAVASSSVVVQLELAELPNLHSNIKELKQLILNFTRNAIEAMPSGGTVRIKTAVCADEVILSFIDQGTGIPDYIMENLGKPFFTTKESGTGLGMAICCHIINRHQAKLRIDTGPKGTTIAVHFRNSIHPAV